MCARGETISVVIPAERPGALCPGAREPGPSTPRRCVIAQPVVTGSRLCASPAKPGSLGRDDISGRWDVLEQLVPPQLRGRLAFARQPRDRRVGAIGRREAAM